MPAVVMVLVFLVVPLVELFLIVNVADWLGILPTIALLVTVSVVGAWLLRREGAGAWQRVQRQISQAEMPTDSLIDGVLIVMAGALMLTPGFLTDLIGLAMMFPPTRIPLRKLLRRRYGRRMATATVGSMPGGSLLGGFRVYGGGIVDSDVVGEPDLGGRRSGSQSSGGMGFRASGSANEADPRGESARVNNGPWGGSHGDVVDAESWEEPPPRPEIGKS